MADNQLEVKIRSLLPENLENLHGVICGACEVIPCVPLEHYAECGAGVDIFDGQGFEDFAVASAGKVDAGADCQKYQIGGYAVVYREVNHRPDPSNIGIPAIPCEGDVMICDYQLVAIIKKLDA